MDYQRAIITGASAGFGVCFARELAPHVQELVLIARRKERMDMLAMELRQIHPSLSIEVMSCDLSQASDRDKLITSLLALAPRKTLLINNAGLGDYGAFVDGAWERIHQLLEVNMTALTQLCHALLPALMEHGGGILNLSSLAASLPIPDFAIYAASKAYVSSFSEALRLELREFGVPVLALCPGPAHTEFGAQARRPGFSGNMMPGRNFFDTEALTVVRSALAALNEGKARCFPNPIVRVLASFLALCPLPLLRFVMGRRPRKVLPTSES